MPRKILSNIFLFISGFFLYGSLLTAFVQAPSFGMKLIAMGVFMIPMLFSLSTGLALRSFNQWQKVCGITFISASIFSAFGFLTFICILYSPEIKSVLDLRSLTFFSDIVSGFSFFLLVLLSGVILFRRFD